MYCDESERQRDEESKVQYLGPSVQHLLDALLKVEDKQARVTIVVEGNTREAFHLASIQDCPGYTTGARTFIRVT